MATLLKNKLSMVRDQVRDAYLKGATLRQIAEIHHVSTGTVRNMLLDMEVSLRPRGRRKKEEVKDPRILPVDAPVEESDDSDANPEPVQNETSTYEGGYF